MSLSEEKQKTYEKRILGVIQDQSDKKMRCDEIATQIGISKDYVLQILIALDEKGLIHLDKAKKAPEKKSIASIA